MPPKSAAERMQEYRQRISVAKKQEVRERNKKQQKYARSKWDIARKKYENDKAKVRVKRWRLEKTVQKSPAAAATESPCHFQAFGSVQSLGKAMKRAEKALPCSPRKVSCGQEVSS